MTYWLLLHFGIAVAGAWMARHYALRGNLMDHPGERRSHTVATPRGGGIAIVAALLCAGGWLLWNGPDQGQGTLLPAFLVGLVLVAGIGWWDDHRPLSPASRLVVQAVAAGLLAMAAGRDSGDPLAAMIAFAAALVLVNVWNFMDGINGLAASQAAIAACGFAFSLQGDWAWLAAGLLAACLGFLPFNFPRARIFLGDVGSGALGFSLAALLAAGWTRSTAPWPLLCLPLCAFLVDAGFTLLRRMLIGERWWTPHVTHLYQSAARRFGHTAVTVIYAAFGGVTLLLTYLLSQEDARTALAATVCVYMGASAMWGILRRRVRG
ncbi:lipopolysaccharide biosynthesis protein [Pseudoxanthomonas putridarboris]|uniref:Lipopolysaccharide biosynthesis protein n=1 Tax=Pseudoxanthomonas putridarboris TaxID=752605 RepID=A0ABU9J033_9GAMM